MCVPTYMHAQTCIQTHTCCIYFVVLWVSECQQTIWQVSPPHQMAFLKDHGPSWSASLDEKCSKEERRLHTKLAKILRENLLRFVTCLFVNNMQHFF